MGGHETDDALARYRTKPPRAYLVGQVLLVAIALAAFVISLPGVDLPGVPDPHGWANTLMRIASVVVVLALIERLAKHRRARRDGEDHA